MFYAYKGKIYTATVTKGMHTQVSITFLSPTEYTATITGRGLSTIPAEAELLDVPELYVLLGHQEDTEGSED